MKSLLVEAIFVGVLVVVVGTVVGYVVGRFASVDLPAACKKWNKYHAMEISLFLTGFFVHIICEYVGLNRWYCKNGRACKRK
jgi:membrane protein DedA with SNARE-associated domain